MLKETPYHGDINRVEITGTISNLMGSYKYIPRPLISFDLVCQRRRKSLQEELVTDVHRVIILDNDKFHEQFQNGERISVIGELQSRNYKDSNYEVDEILKQGVKHYFDLFGEYPMAEQPRNKFEKVAVDWEKMIKTGLLSELPEDSLFDLYGNKQNTNVSFNYRIDKQGGIYKEKDHVAYEIITNNYRKLDKPVDEKKGDLNFVTLCGTVSTEPEYQLLGEKEVPFCRLNIRTGDSKLFAGRFYYNHAISWSELAKQITSTVKARDIVKVTGRLQSREYEKVVINKWTTEFGRRKRKKVTLTMQTREVSCSKVEIVKEREVQHGEFSSTGVSE